MVMCLDRAGFVTTARQLRRKSECILKRRFCDETGRLRKQEPGLEMSWTQWG